MNVEFEQQGPYIEINRTTLSCKCFSLKLALQRPTKIKMLQEMQVPFERTLVHM